MTAIDHGGVCCISVVQRRNVENTLIDNVLTEILDLAAIFPGPHTSKVHKSEAKISRQPLRTRGGRHRLALQQTHRKSKTRRRGCLAPQRIPAPGFIEYGHTRNKKSNA